jgi:hypothetical protein
MSVVDSSGFVHKPMMILILLEGSDFSHLIESQSHRYRLGHVSLCQASKSHSDSFEINVAAKSAHPLRAAPIINKREFSIRIPPMSMQTSRASASASASSSSGSLYPLGANSGSSVGSGHSLPTLTQPRPATTFHQEAARESAAAAYHRNSLYGKPRNE